MTNIGAPGRDDAPLPGAETVIFEGSVSLWTGLGAFITSTLLEALALAGLMYAMNKNTELLLPAGALVAAASLLPVVLMVSIRSKRYKITQRLVERETGVLRRRVDSLDLARVKDIELTQSFIERIVNIGTIEVYSSDRTDPVMLIEGMPNSRPVYEKLRDAVIEISRQRGVIIE